MKLATIIATLAASPALAHAGPHLHPHGAEVVAIGLALAALAWLIATLTR